MDPVTFLLLLPSTKLVCRRLAPWPFCFTSTEVRWLITDRDWGWGGGGGKSEGSTMDTAQKRLERLWTTTRTMEVLRRCPLTIAQRLVHCATAAVLGRVTKTMSTALLFEEQPEAKEVQLLQPSYTSLLLISPGLNYLRVQLHPPPLNLSWNPVLAPLRPLPFYDCTGWLGTNNKKPRSYFLPLQPSQNTSYLL